MGYSAGSTGEVLWQDTRRDPPASYSDILSGMLGGIHWQAVVGYSAGSTGEPLWWDTWRDPLAIRSGGILGGIHWRAALAGYWAGSTGCSGGILGGIHWRAALAVGAWCRSIANADSNIKSNNPFLSGGEQIQSRPFLQQGAFRVLGDQVPSRVPFPAFQVSDLRILARDLIENLTVGTCSPWTDTLIHCWGQVPNI